MKKKKKPRFDFANDMVARDFYALGMKICLSNEHTNATMPAYVHKDIQKILNNYYESFNAYNGEKLYSDSLSPIVERCINKLIFCESNENPDFIRSLKNIKSKKYNYAKRKTWIKAAYKRAKVYILRNQFDERDEYYSLMIFSLIIVKCFLQYPKQSIRTELFERYLNNLSGEEQVRLHNYYNLNTENKEKFYRLNKKLLNDSDNLIELQILIFTAKRRKHENN